MNNIGLRLFKELKEIPRGVGKVAPYVRAHGEALRSHPFAEWTESRNRIDAWVMPLLSLQTAHLQNQRLGAAYFHAVRYVSNLHTGCLNPRVCSAGGLPLLNSWLEAI
jgi:hypothetical protein